ncbi:MAG: non-canonical purine NTP pyrophosphatase [Planctomycetaceae bacterium]|nr:non-canonical purine NTP pyrophosphatase [Planctomycetaceae bacterium]
MSPTLVIGSGNKKKGRELSELVGPLGIAVLTLADFPRLPPVDETGRTFADNAALKAVGYARQLRHWVLADDSGLCVDALGGLPGVDSALYAGRHGDDEANNDKLLAELGDAPPDRRTAYYVCHVVLADPAGAIRFRTEDYCRGRIVRERDGSGGFGYDPLFEIVEYHRTFGTLSPAVKACISHRARAMRKLLPMLEQLASTGALG